MGAKSSRIGPNLEKEVMNTPIKLTLTDLSSRKNGATPISMLTCYDHAFAKILNQSNVDLLLVGDSLANVIYGYDSTLHATAEMMIRHTEAVCRGAPNKFVVADMPFLATRKGSDVAVQIAGDLMKAGASAVKIENTKSQEQIIKHIVESGIPVMGHLGLTPQYVHMLGGMKVQGRSEESRSEILRDAHKFQELGAFSLVLECVPSSLAKEITTSCLIPTIGIGAGSNVDGQVLVLHDALGLNLGFKPKFLRKFGDLEAAAKEAIDQFVSKVQQSDYPNAHETYSE